MTLLAIEELSKTFQDDHEDVKALAKTSLTVKDGEFVSIIGPSGCGKSTLLDIIAGIQKLTMEVLAIKENPSLGKEVYLAICHKMMYSFPGELF